MAKDDPAPQMIPDLHEGRYSDGHPLDDVHYLECKIILKPDRFTSRQGFVDFAKLARRAAEKADVELSSDHLDGQRPEIREVVFLDTADFRLYNNAFILRRRIAYEDGFQVGGMVLAHWCGDGGEDNLGFGECTFQICRE